MRITSKLLIVTGHVALISHPSCVFIVHPKSLIMNYTGCLFVFFPIVALISHEYAHYFRHFSSVSLILVFVSTQLICLFISKMAFMEHTIIVASHLCKLLFGRVYLRYLKSFTLTSCMTLITRSFVSCHTTSTDIGVGTGGGGQWDARPQL